MRSRNTGLARPSALAALGVRPSRARGQNFLTQPAVAARIVKCAELEPGDHVVEVGPGLGMLTERIAAQNISHLTLIELDRRLAGRLEKSFAPDRRVRIINADFIEVDLSSLGAPLKILGNLPFNAAGAIFRRLCEHADQIARMVLMFQREVAERIRAQPGDEGYSALSVFSALYFTVDEHFRVGAGNFRPRPNVDAEVVVFSPRARPFAPAEQEAVLSAIRASFAAPRKTIRNSVALALSIEPSHADDVLRRAGIDPGVRAETLGVPEFVSLARALGDSGAGRGDA